MTLIAISARTEWIASYNEKRDALDQRWWHFFKECGLLPLFIPNDEKLASDILDKFHPQGVLLSGGNEDMEREKVEVNLINYAIKHNLPILGVCHGMQVIQKYFGVTLQKINGHITPQQTINLANEKIKVNSYHEFGTCDSVDELTVWARADDDIIKAIKHVQLPIAGIMWHPERENPFSSRDLTFIKTFFTTGSSCEQSY